MNDFIVHACEQVLRFSQVKNWNDLSEGRKVQIGFNMGVMSLGLNLTKEDGYTSLVNVREGVLSMQEFHNNMKDIISKHNIQTNEENISKPFQ